MTEKEFIEENSEKWKELESLLEKSGQDPERIHELFVKVSSDLSYARTFYTNRSVRLYLNNLTQSVYDKLTKKKVKFSIKPVTDFFSHILPIEIYKARKSLLISFLIFSAAVLIGAFSSSKNPDFLALVVGERYVEMTEENINKGDPMAVYKDSSQEDMFFRITINNIRVSFLAFVLGFFFGIGTIFVLVSNGIMLGAFQYFFYSKGLFLTSFLTIWIHGTIEISAIIIAGGAGLLLGKGVALPKTYKRSTSMQLSAISAMRIILGAIPLFIIAGMFESFVTRLTEMPTFMKVLIIGGSLCFVLFMWVFYPYYYVNSRKFDIEDHQIMPVPDEEKKSERVGFRNIQENFVLTVQDIKRFGASIFNSVIFPSFLVFAVSIWYYLHAQNIATLVNGVFVDLKPSSGIWLLVVFIINFVWLKSLYHYQQTDITWFGFMRKFFLRVLPISIVLVLPFYFFGLQAVYLFLIFPLQIFCIWAVELIEDTKESYLQKLAHAIRFSYKRYFSFLIENLLTLLCFGLIYLIFWSLGSFFLEKILEWHKILPFTQLNGLFYSFLTFFLAGLLTIPFSFYFFANTYHSLLCKFKGLDLIKQYEDFGNHSTVLEV